MAKIRTYRKTRNILLIILGITLLVLLHHCHHSQKPDILQSSETVHETSQQKGIILEEEEEQEEQRTKQRHQKEEEAQREEEDDEYLPTMDIDLLEIEKWSRRVLFLWCGGSRYMFQHYVHALSVIKNVNPSSVVFAYSQYPSVEKRAYDTWFVELKKSLPFWTEKKVDSGVCSSSKHPRLEDIKNIAKDISHPILFVSSSTVFRRPFEAPSPLVNVNSYNESTGEGFYLLVDPHVSALHNTMCPTVNLMEKDSQPARQTDRQTDRQTYSGLSCFAFGESSTFNPEDIMYLATPAAADIRRVFYGSAEMPRPAYDTAISAPRIAHYIWIGKNPLHVNFYLSILSALCIAELEKVCIHADHQPHGLYWQRLNEREDLASRIRYIPMVKPELVYGQKINVIPHLADIIKSSLMYQHGGVMMDPDLYFVQRLPDELFHYDVVFTVGILPSKHFPDIFNMGVSISKPRSQFARLWLDSEREFVDGDWNWNCGRVTYKFWERNPRLAKVDRRLQLLCTDRCYPFWLAGKAYKQMKAFKGDPMAGVNWRTDVWSIHDPHENIKDLKHLIERQQGIIGEMGRMILRAGGMLGEKQGLQP